MQAQTEPQTSPSLSSSALTWAGLMCERSSTGISIDWKPHFLKVLNNAVLSLVKGEVNRKVLMPSLIVEKYFPTGYGNSTHCQKIFYRRRARRAHPNFVDLSGASH